MSQRAILWVAGLGAVGLAFAFIRYRNLNGPGSLAYETAHGTLGS
jgi:hypothetical protein